MSDRKHIEYCIKLGNTLMQQKLDAYRTGQYIEPQINNNMEKEAQNMNFRERLRSWNT